MKMADEIGPQFVTAIVKVFQLLGDFPQTPTPYLDPAEGLLSPQTPCSLPCHFPNCAGTYDQK